MKKAIIVLGIIIALVGSFTFGELHALHSAQIGVDPDTYKSEITTHFLDGWHRFKYDGVYSGRAY